jgi:glycosyltransferase involved in cell wall biosynthesis
MIHREWGEIWRRIRGRPHPVLLPHAPTLDPNLRSVNQRFENDQRRLLIGTVERFRVLLFAPSLNLEGAPLSQLELTRALAERDVIEAEVVSFKDGPLREHYRQLGIPVRVCEPVLPNIPTVKCYDAAVDRIAALIREKSPGLVYANTLLNFPAIAAAELAGVPSIWNVREGEPPDSCFGFLSSAVAARAVGCLSLPYRVIFVAQAAADNWARFNLRNNFAVVRNGIAPRRPIEAADESARNAERCALGIASNEIMVLNIGTVCERKGQRDLIAAIARLPREILAHTKVFCVGDEPGPYSRALRTDIAALPAELKARVSLLPTTSDVAPFYRAADIFALTSYREAYPRVVLEAMDYGLPIVSARSGGVVEQVEEGRNALLYTAGDVEALGSHLERILSDEALRQHLRSGSPEMLARLPTFEQMIEAYSGTFREAYLSQWAEASSIVTNKAR